MRPDNFIQWISHYPTVSIISVHWFSVWSLSCRCRVKFNSLRSISLALSYSCLFLSWSDLLQILRKLTICCTFLTWFGHVRVWERFGFSHLSLNTTATFFGSFVHCSWSRHDVGRIWKRFRPVRGHCHVHLAEHSTRSVVLLNVSLHRADESQVARNSCPRLPRLILGLVSIMSLSC